MHDLSLTLLGMILLWMIQKTIALYRKPHKVKSS
jgi:hypothetical protein